jgi:hypothetical protein
MNHVQPKQPAAPSRLQRIAINFVLIAGAAMSLADVFLLRV